MTEEQKSRILCDYENIELYPKLGKREFKNIHIFSKDEDTFIRSQAASLLVNFRTKSSRKRLFNFILDRYCEEAENSKLS